MKTNKIYQFDNLIFKDVSVDIIEEGYKELINNHEIIKFLENPTKKFTTSDLHSYIKINLEKNNTYFFQIRHKKFDVYLGNCKLGPIQSNNSGEFGRLIYPYPKSPKGTGTKIIEFLKWFSFEHLNLNKITSGCDIANIASLKSNLNAGMVLEGTFKDHLYDDKGYKTVHRFGLTKSNYCNHIKNHLKIIEDT